MNSQSVDTQAGTQRRKKARLESKMYRKLSQQDTKKRLNNEIEGLGLRSFVQINCRHHWELQRQQRRAVPNGRNPKSPNSVVTSTAADLVQLELQRPQSPTTAIMGSSAEDHHYHPKDTIARTASTTGVTGFVGLFASAVQNTLVRRNVGSWAIFTRSGSTIAIFAAMGGTYEFVKTASANLRETDDHWNVALGGFFSGAILGLRVRTFPALLGYGAALATTLGGFEYSGGSLFGKKKDSTVDEFDRREQLRTQWRTPGEQTLAELGEGRGIYGPGYAERRRERIKAAYGIDVVTNAPAS
ncbi:hypothetical protein BJX70DRAFT_110692 [Aspergillus crustosus]